MNEGKRLSLAKARKAQYISDQVDDFAANARREKKRQQRAHRSKITLEAYYKAKQNGKPIHRGD